MTTNVDTNIYVPIGALLTAQKDDGISFLHHGCRVIVSDAAELDGYIWRHASMTRQDGKMPTYYDLKRLHEWCFGNRAYAYQTFSPEDRHVNIHQKCLHLWGRVDGSAALPDFTRGGKSI